MQLNQCTIIVYADLIIVYEVCTTVKSPTALANRRGQFHIVPNGKKAHHYSPIMYIDFLWDSCRDFPMLKYG